MGLRLLCHGRPARARAWPGWPWHILVAAPPRCPTPLQRSDAAGALPGGHAGEHVGQLLLGVQLLCEEVGIVPGSDAPAQAASGNNGNVAGSWYQDNVNPSFSHTEAYGYDGVNRLTSAVATGNSLYNLAYSYDRYGNSNCVLNGNTNGPCAQFAYNAANQITGYGYDAAGNTTYDGTYTYTWDAEGRLSTSWQGATLEHTYTYNAFGQRAEDIPDTQTGNTQEWFYDPSGQVLGDFFAYPPQPGWWHMLVPALGRTFVDVEGWYEGGQHGSTTTMPWVVPSPPPARMARRCSTHSSTRGGEVG